MDQLLSLGFSETDLATRSLVRQIVEREVTPNAIATDRDGVFPRRALQALAQAGLVGLLFPTEHGGSGGSMLQYCITMEEIAQECAATAATFMTQVHGLLPILIAGTEEQKARWLPAALRGEQVAAIALTEPAAGSDLSALRTRAERHGDEFEITGSKIFITNGGESDQICVFARTSDEPHAGISVFVVGSKSDGISFGAPMSKMGIRGSNTAEVFFDRVRVPADQLIGPLGTGFTVAMGALGDARISTAAQANGIAHGAWKRAFDYAHVREQFGTRIYDFQAVQLRLMDLMSKVCSARLLVYQLARMIDAGVRTEYSVEASMAKTHCSDVAMEVASRCVDVLGGYGYMREYEVERFMRDAKITQIYDGTNDINRIAMARQLSRRARAGEPVTR